MNLYSLTCSSRSQPRKGKPSTTKDTKVHEGNQGDSHSFVNLRILMSLPENMACLQERTECVG